MNGFKRCYKVFLVCFCFFVALSQIVDASEQGRLAEDASNSGNEIYTHRLQNQRAKDFMERLVEIAESTVVPEAVRGKFKSSIASCLLEEKSNCLVFIGENHTLDKLKKLVRALDVPSGQLAFQVLAFETSIENASAFCFEGLASFNNQTNTDVFLGSSICYQGKSMDSMAELAQTLLDDASVNVLWCKTFPVKEYANVTTSKTTVYKLEKGLLASLPENTVAGEEQFFEGGLTLRLNPIIHSGSEIGLKICLESITPNPNHKGLSTNESTIPDGSSLFTSKQVKANIVVPNGVFVSLPGIVLEDCEEEGIVQIPCLGGMSILGGANKHKRVSEQQSIFVIIRPCISEMREAPQLEHLFD